MSSKIPSTQQNIEIADIKDGIIFLNDGGYRIILSCAAINFALKSEQEQNAIVFQYQSFLNSLHFPIQIVMQSKKLDLAPYIKKINDSLKLQTNDLIKMQTEDYVDFVQKLITMANIMKKSFYVIVPYQPINMRNSSFLDKLVKRNSGKIRVSEQEFKHHKDELLEHANTVAYGLGSMGIQCVQLNTEEIIELFYRVYNPEEAGKERFDDANKLVSSYVASETEKNPQPQPVNQPPEQKPEAIIVNTQVVQEKQKQEAQMKQRETLKQEIGQKKQPPAVTPEQAAEQNAQGQPTQQQ